MCVFGVAKKKEGYQVIEDDEAEISSSARYQMQEQTRYYMYIKPTSGIGEKDVVFRFTQNPFGFFLLVAYKLLIQHEEYSM